MSAGAQLFGNDRAPVEAYYRGGDSIRQRHPCLRKPREIFFSMQLENENH
jgi:hypothetical protein